MEGYFPVCKYCELTGLKKDTVLHRANRGTVDCFKNKEGRWFLYYCDDALIVPEGYISVDEFAISKGLNVRTLRRKIKCGKISKDNIVCISSKNSYIIRGAGKRIYIRKDAEISKRRSNKTELYTPEGYLTTGQWAKREGINKHNLYYWICRDYLNYQILNGHYYIPETETKDIVKQRIKFKKECDIEWLLKLERKTQKLTGS